MASSEKESTTAPVWAKAPRARMTVREWAAMRRCCCQVPGMAVPRGASGALGLVLMCMGAAVSVGCLLEGPPRGALGVLPVVVVICAGWLLLLTGADGTLWLWKRMERWLRARPPAEIGPDGICFQDGQRVPLRRLKAICRYTGCTVLVWGDWRHPRALIVKDSDCIDNGNIFWKNLRAAAPRAQFRYYEKMPSIVWRGLSTGLVLFLLVVLADLSFHYRLQITPTIALIRVETQRGQGPSLPPRPTPEPAPEHVPEPTPTPKPTPTPEPTLPPVPTPAATHPLLDDVKFDATVDARLTNDGLYFTWDGGQTVSRPAGAELVPAPLDEDTVVITEEVGAFLTSLDWGRGSWVVAHTTTDQGATWNDCELANFTDVPPVEEMHLGFLGADFGYAAVSSGSTPATGIGVGIYTTRDGGKSWQPCAAPLKNNLSHPVTSLLFIDEQTGVATLGTASDDPWPMVFLTQDGGQSWQQLTMPWDDPALTGQARDFLLAGEEVLWLDGATALTREEDAWTLTLTQAPEGRREAVFSASDPAGTWTLQQVRETG